MGLAAPNGLRPASRVMRWCGGSAVNQDGASNGAGRAQWAAPSQQSDAVVPRSRREPVTLDHVDQFVDGAAVNRGGTLTYAALAARAGDAGPCRPVRRRRRGEPGRHADLCRAGVFGVITRVRLRVPPDSGIRPRYEAWSFPDLASSASSPGCGCGCHRIPESDRVTRRGRFPIWRLCAEAPGTSSSILYVAPWNRRGQLCSPAARHAVRRRQEHHPVFCMSLHGIAAASCARPQRATLCVWPTSRSPRSGQPGVAPGVARNCVAIPDDLPCGRHLAPPGQVSPVLPRAWQGIVWLSRTIYHVAAAVIGVGAPWYTSGIQEWNGTARP